MRKLKDLLLTFGYRIISLARKRYYNIYTRYDSAYGNLKIIRYVKEGDKIVKKYERFALEDIVKRINKESISWLDVGSGPGKTQEVLKKMSEKFGIEINYLGIEVREKAVEEAKKYGANVILGDATEKKTLEDALKILKGNPDVVSFIGSIQHFHPDGIKKILEFTKPKYVYVRANLGYNKKWLLASILGVGIMLYIHPYFAWLPIMPILIGYLTRTHYLWTSEKIIKTLKKFGYKPFYVRRKDKKSIDILFKKI